MSTRTELSRRGRWLLLVLLLGGCAVQPPTPHAPADDPLKTRLDEQEAVHLLVDYARLLLREGHFARAEALLDRLRRQRPDDVDLLESLARACEGQGKARRALLVREQAYRLRPDDRAIGADFARSAMLAGQYNAADAVYRRWLENAPPHSPEAVAALNNLGYSSLLQEQPQRALDYLQRALERDPLNSKARANRALTYAILGKPAEARQESALLGGAGHAP